MTFKHIITEIESLPPLSNTPFVIQQIYSCGSQNIDIIRLVKVIENDATLAANILKMINDPVYGFSRRIASISQAVTLFGTDEIYGLVLKYAIGERLRADTEIYGVDNKRFNDVCQLQSSLMMQWYSRVDLRHAQFMAPLALIMESGKLVLANEVMKSNYSKQFSAGYKNTKSPIEYEHNLLGTTTYYLSALLFEHWKFEPLYVEILKGLDFETNASQKVKSYIDSLDAVRVAINPKYILTPDSIKEACEIVQDMGLDADDFEHIAKRVKEQYSKVVVNRLTKK
jgi:HD-like signal output (HDOD) protein